MARRLVKLIQNENTKLAFLPTLTSKNTYRLAWESEQKTCSQ